MSSIVYLNGQYLPIDKAKISVLDRGFTFGDGVYEVVPVYHGHIFRLKKHIERLNNSLDEVYIDRPHDPAQWQEILRELIDQNPAEDHSLYIQVTRGVSERDHAIDTATKPTVFAMCRPLLKKDRSAGISAIVEEDIRWKYCHIKAITLLPSVILKHKAKQAGCVARKENGRKSSHIARNLLLRARRMRSPLRGENEKITYYEKRTFR